MKLLKNLFKYFTFSVVEEDVSLDTSLDDSLAAALKDHYAREGRDDEGETDEVDEIIEDEEETEQEEVAEKPQEKAPKSKEEKPKPEDDTIYQDTEEDVKPEPKQEEKQLRRPPSTWTAKGKADFNKLPDHIQEEVLKRESDFHNGIQGYKERAEYGEKINRVIQPYEAIIRASNSTPEQAISNLLDAAYRLNTGSQEQKTQTFMQLARQYNIDLAALNQPQEEKPAYVQQLEQQLAQLQHGIQSQQQYVQQQNASEVNSSIEQFRNESDESGSPKHLYFDDVRDEMADRLEAAARNGRQLSLQEAYDAAVWARPDIRETLLASQQQAAELKRKQDQAEKARQAKRKASVNVSTTGSHASKETKQVGSIDDTMREVMAKAKARDD